MSDIEKRLATDETLKLVAENLEGIMSAISGKKKGVVYGFHVNGKESNPASKITYLRDAVGMTPIRLVNGVIDYGSWKDAFFMPKPCMVKYDGKTDYYLNENDYSKKEDGTASDVSDESYNGNAMMEWGKNGRIWYKVVPDFGDNTSASIYIADHKEDEDFVCWSFINNQGKMVDRFYTPIYNGTIDSNGRLRSLSGKDYTKYCKSKTAQGEIDAAKLNNQGSEILWYTEVYADVTIINLLLYLVGKSTDVQGTFGQGRSGYSWNESNMGTTGLMDAKGLFYGETSTTGIGVKVFGMENWWGNQWRRYAGHINASGTQKVKYTYGTQDESTTIGYNTNGNGYIDIGATPTGSSGGYCDICEFGHDGFAFKNASGTATTHYCDGFWFNNGQTNYALRGGDCYFEAPCGVAVGLDYSPASAYWGVGAALSLKPLV